MITNVNGVTIRQLKEMLKDWPEEDSNNEETMVWIETGKGLSSPVKAIYPLNQTSIIFEL